MLEEGFLAEVERLELEGIRQNPSAAQAIGYRQALAYLQSAKTEKEYRRFLEEFKQASRHYAKRQMTWFRREPLFRWLDVEMDPEVAIDQIVTDYYAHNS